MKEHLAQETSMSYNRNTMIIRETESRRQEPVSTQMQDLTTKTMFVSPIPRSSGGEDNLQGEGEKEGEMTEKELAEVEKELEAPMMDTDMIKNDDLLDEELDPEVEKIEAISHLSSRVSQYKKPGLHFQTARVQEDLADLPPQEPLIPRKRADNNSEIKGSMASRKLQSLRFRPSPKKKHDVGKASASSAPSANLPRNEVFPSARSKKSSTLSGSVVSQKPPSKKI